MTDIDLRALMPHQPPMLLVDRVTAAREDGGEAEALFGPDSLFARPGGLVDEAVHFELIAQAFAACTGAWRARAGADGGPRPGFLVSLRDVVAHGPARLASPLQIRVKATDKMEDFVFVDGEVFQDDRLIASGQVVIVIPGGALA